jgi:pilus assembly protein CpaE
VLVVTVVGQNDSDLEALVRQAGMQVSVIGPSELTALTAPTAREPDVMLLDVRGGAPFPVAFAPLKRQHPQIGVVMIASSLDPGLLLEAMRSGVTEVVVDPVSQDDLEAAIGKVIGQRQSMTFGRVFAIVGAKGGVGATTVAVNVATVLGAASKPSRTLLMDLHQAGGDAAVFLGAEPRFSIQDALENTSRLDAVFLKSIVTQVAPALDLLASPDRPGVPHSDSAGFRRVIEFVASSYKYTILDVPRSDAAALDALDLADSIVVVANQELATVRSASRLSSMLRTRYGRDKVTVVLSRLDRRADIVDSDVEKVIGSPLAHMFPSDYRAALQALNKGRPLALGNHNELSTSFKRFALQLAGVRPDRESAPRAGLFGRLTQRGA